MSISEMEQARHAAEKGAILLTLKQDYSSRMSSVASLGRALALVGHPMRPAGLEFALQYLAEAGYVKIWRADEMPGWRADRAQEVRAEQIVFTRLTNKGLQLVDGEIVADPKVAF